MPGQSVRKDSVRKKLNTIPSEFSEKTVLIVDDSIVRGNTSKRIVEMARNAGAKKVFFASAAPPIIHPNVYGIDMPTRSELIAYDRSEEEIRLELGVDNLVFQELDHMLRDVLSFNSTLDGLEASCFNGSYITGKK